MAQHQPVVSVGVAEHFGPIVLLGMAIAIFLVAVVLAFAGQGAVAITLVATAMIGAFVATVLDRLEIIDLFGLMEAKLRERGAVADVDDDENP